MSVILYCVGAFAVVVGVLMVAWGIPVNEFSIGNTLIIAGTTSAVGGLVIIALGVAVSRLERIAEALATRAPARPGRPEAFETPTNQRAVPAPGRSPFPPMTTPDADLRGHPPEPRMAMPAPQYPPQDQAGQSFAGRGFAGRDLAGQDFAAQDFAAQDFAAQDYAAQAYPPQEYAAPSFAPTLRNPEEPPTSGVNDVALSAQQPAPSPPFAINGSGLAGKRQGGRQENRQGPTPDTDWQPPPAPAAPAQTRQPQKPEVFDSMWPDQPRPPTSKSPSAMEGKPEHRRDPSLREALPAPAKRPAGEARGAAAILKSGVVDGMGYTLYVDGSIEAELPQGTLRFASINELRSHLEKSA